MPKKNLSKTEHKKIIGNMPAVRASKEDSRYAKVREHLKSGESLSQRQAIELYDAIRLSAIVFELTNKEGMSIEPEVIDGEVHYRMLDVPLFNPGAAGLRYDLVDQFHDMQQGMMYKVRVTELDSGRVATSGYTWGELNARRQALENLQKQKEQEQEEADYTGKNLPEL